jgi:hypothetical protein
MTDGAGFMNTVALRLLTDQFPDWDIPTCAVQVRIAGAKVCLTNFGLTALLKLSLGIIGATSNRLQ